MRKFGERFWKKPEFSFRHLEMKNAEKYLREMVMMYNKIWSDFLETYTPLKYEDLYQIFQDAKAILNEKYIWFGYHNEQPIGFLIVFPDMNQVFRKLKNGKLSPVNILKFMYYKRRAITRGRLLIIRCNPRISAYRCCGRNLPETYGCHARGWPEGTGTFMGRRL